MPYIKGVAIPVLKTEAVDDISTIIRVASAVHVNNMKPDLRDLRECARQELRHGSARQRPSDPSHLVRHGAFLLAMPKPLDHFLPPVLLYAWFTNNVN